MKTLVAPVLCALMDDLWANAHGKKPHPKASMEGNRRVIRMATSDLDDLLAVAAAVRVWRCEHKDEECFGCNRVIRAINRLDRRRP